MCSFMLVLFVDWLYFVWLNCSVIWTSEISGLSSFHKVQHFCSYGCTSVTACLIFSSCTAFWHTLFTRCGYGSTCIYRVSQEERAKLQEGVPYVKFYRYNPKHLCPKLNGYGDKGQRKVWSFCGSTYCTWFAWRNTHTLRVVCPCLQLAQARYSLRLHM